MSTDKKGNSNSNNENYENLAQVANDAKNTTKKTLAVLSEVFEKYVAEKGKVVDVFNELSSKVVGVAKRLDRDVDHFVNSNRQLVLGFIDGMSETRPISSTDGTHVVKLFINACIFLLVSSIGSFIGSYIASFVFAWFFLEFGAFLVAVIVVPLVAIYQFKNFKFNGHSQRQGVAMCSILEQAIFIGYVTREYYLDVPSAVLSQVIASFMYPIALTKTCNRLQVFGTVAASGFILHLVIGLFTSSLSLGFLVVAALYSVLTIALIQYTIEFRAKTDFDDSFITMQYVLIVAAFKMLGLLIFGVSDHQYRANH